MDDTDAGASLRHREARRLPATRDSTRTDDTRIGAVRPLITPALLLEKLPGSEATLGLVERSRAAIARVLHGLDDRLIVVVGPCSIHDHDQALDYAARLQAAAEPLADALLVVMRTYFEKPRTTVGWKGYINDPQLDGSFAINEGLERARRLLLQIVERGLPVGAEFLDLLSPQFISDLVAWGAIGARTTESQSHRQLASGLSCPVGFKNGTDGGVKIAADAIVAAAAQHAFMGMTKMGQAAIFETRGNHDCHVILRGGRQPNYGAEAVDAACAVLRARRPARAGHDRRLACQQRQAAPAPDRGRRRHRAAHRRRRPAHHRRDDREPPRGRPAGPGAGPAAAPRRVDHRRLHFVGADRAGAAFAGASRARAARRPHARLARSIRKTIAA